MCGGFKFWMFLHSFQGNFYIFHTGDSQFPHLQRGLFFGLRLCSVAKKLGENGRRRDEKQSLVQFSLPAVFLPLPFGSFCLFVFFPLIFNSVVA